MLTVRLPDELENEINALAEKKKMTKSDIVKEALSKYIKDHVMSPYEAGKDLFGCDDSPGDNLSLTYKKQVEEAIHEKNSD